MYKETLFLNVWIYSKVWQFLIVLLCWFLRNKHTNTWNLYGYLLFSCFRVIIYAQISSNNCHLFFCTMHAILRYLVKIIDRRKFHNFVQLVSYPFCFMFKLNWRKLCYVHKYLYMFCVLLCCIYKYMCTVSVLMSLQWLYVNR